jgi:zinc transport system substrate-binding protein
MPLRLLCLTAILLGLSAAGPGALRAEAPGVVASIKPVHSLVAGVMLGVGEPALLVSGAGSPHSYSLRPSEARALNHADLVFWVGDQLETFLIKPLDALAARAVVVELGAAEGVLRLPSREGGLWEAHADDEDGDQPRDAGQEQRRLDMHLLLDPRNAAAMVGAIVAALAAADPAHAADYDANGRRLEERLERLDDELGAKLAAIGERPFLVFHDAYQYLEHRYQLNAVGSITIDPQRRPGAQRLTELRAKVQALKVACVFAEPQFEPALVDTVIEDTTARKGVLDPLGAGLEARPEHYFQLMDGLADALVACLSQ